MGASLPSLIVLLVKDFTRLVLLRGPGGALGLVADEQLASEFFLPGYHQSARVCAHGGWACAGVLDDPEFSNDEKASINPAETLKSE